MDNDTIFQIVQDEILQLVDSQRALESQFQKVSQKQGEISGMSSVGKKDKQANAQRQAAAAAAELRNSTHVFARSLQQNPLTADNLQKVQSDRYALTVHNVEASLCGLPASRTHCLTLSGLNLPLSS